MARRLLLVYPLGSLMVLGGCSAILGFDGEWGDLPVGLGGAGAHAGSGGDGNAAGVGASAGSGGVGANAGSGGVGASAGSGGGPGGQGGTGGVAGSGGSGPVSCNEPSGHVWPQNGHCYFTRDTLEHWGTHKDACEASGARMVTITSAAEQSFVESISGDGGWIGLRRPLNGSFAWVGNEPVSYTNWNAGEPDEPGEACTKLRNDDFLWSDKPCSDSYGAVCERE